MSQIPRIILDPDDDAGMLEQMYIRCEAASEGTITDFRQGSVMASLYEGVVYSLSELLWYLNLLPEALAIEVMRYSTGVTRIDGTPASGSLTFVLDDVRATDFYINRDDLKIPWKDSFFTLDSDLVIPAGTHEVTASATCAATGSAYNVPRVLDINYQPPLNGLNRVYNPFPITNATDLEPITQTLERMQAVYRSGGVLIDDNDFILKATEVIGTGSRVQVVPLLDNNLTANTPGHIHIFAVNADGNLPSTAQCAVYRETLQSSSFSGIYTWVSPAVYEQVNIELVIQVTDISDELAESIADSVREFFDFRTYPMGQAVTLDNLKYVIRRNNEADILAILTCTVNDEATDLPLLYRWSLPQVNDINIKLTDAEGSSQYILGDIVGDIA
jgi:uncharacterized phage protein gp47/JayE